MVLKEMGQKFENISIRTKHLEKYVSWRKENQYKNLYLIDNIKVPRGQTSSGLDTTYENCPHVCPIGITLPVLAIGHGAQRGRVNQLFQ